MNSETGKNGGNKPSAFEDLIAKISEALSKGVVELHDVEIEVDELEIILQPIVAKAIAPVTERIERRLVELAKVTFEEVKLEFPGRVVEVRMGATRAEGGTRDKSIVLGGENLPPYFYITGLEPAPHLPAFGGDIFDMRIPLPKAVRDVFGDALDNPIEWARVWVNKFGAEAIDVHLISTDPTIKDTPASESAKLIEDLLQQVKVPIVVGGSGNPKKDVEVFKKVVDVAEGERVVLNSLNLDMDLKDICQYLSKKDAVVINFAPMDLDKAREINRKVYDWIPRDRIMLDLNIAGIGYGIEYGFTVNERARLAALIGDVELQHPFNVGAANAWSAREAWISMDPYWGPREIRGPLWETLTCIICLLTGADYFMLLHPTSMGVLKDIRDYLFTEPNPSIDGALEWISAKL
ncbi:MAG: CO dehydrogenase/acetyl-CoA synthase subunit delta [Desulfurococcaceae archaeon]